ncbi:MAG: SDR family oxidoreductase [Stellaceae bacterium]
MAKAADCASPRRQARGPSVRHPAPCLPNRLRLCPGPVETRMMRSLEAQHNRGDPRAVHDANSAKTPAGRYATPVDVANLVMYLCSDLAGDITDTHLLGGAKGAAMLKWFVAGIVVTIVVAAVGGYIVLQRGLVPANADAKPGSLETWAAKTSLRATLAREAPKIANPVALTEANLAAGVGLYGQHCAICHGTAKGDASASPVAKGEYPKPPQLATDGVEDDPEGYSFWKISHGIRWTGMPSWKGSLTDQQIWTLALFLKHMDKLPPATEQAWQQVKN